MYFKFITNNWIKIFVFCFFLFCSAIANAEIKITASDGAADHLFGSAVAVDGDRILIGAPGNGVVPDFPGSAYLFDRDNDTGIWSEIAVLSPSDGNSSDMFGYAVDLCGDDLIIGAISHKGDRVSSGAAYIFKREADNTWKEVTKLYPLDGGNRDRYGWALAIEKNTAVVGAFWNDAQGEKSGAVYVYQRNGNGLWTEQTKLVGADINAGDYFGNAVTILNGTIFIGAQNFNNSDAWRDDGTGAVYVFKKDATGQWMQKAKLIANDVASGDKFGHSLSAYDDKVVIGSPSNNHGAGIGALYIFNRNNEDIWTQTEKLTVPGTRSLGCYSVNLSDNFLVTALEVNSVYDNAAYFFRKSPDGTWQHHTRLSAKEYMGFGGNTPVVAMGIDFTVVGAPGDKTLEEEDIGSAYIYEHQTPFKLTPERESTDDRFGSDVSISGDTALVGASFDNENGERSGSAYIFQQTASNSWQMSAKLTPTDAAPKTFFGGSVCIDGNYAIMGSMYDDESALNAGAAYIFKNQDGIWVELDKLLPPANYSDLNFGSLVSLAGDHAVIGCRHRSFFFYERKEDGHWKEKTELSLIDLRNVSDIAISGNYAVVGASRGIYAGWGGPYHGVVKIFKLNESGQWINTAILSASNKHDHDHFGLNVSIFDRHIAIGSSEDSGSSVYIFERNDDDTWTETTKLSPPDSTICFGNVAIAGDVVVVGDECISNNGHRAGAAFIYRQDSNGAWLLDEKKIAFDTRTEDYFGTSVGVSGSHVIIGASLDDDMGEDSGSAYIYTISIDTDEDGIPDHIEIYGCTNPEDADTDDDGIVDGDEDINWNGIVDPDETDPCNIDSDGDEIHDGTEQGVTLADIGIYTNTNVFQPDLDPSTTTNALLADTDGDRFDDGVEDLNHNGQVDAGESDPNDINSVPLAGDINGDDTIDLADAMLALKIAVGIDPGQTIYNAADVDGDDKIGIEDAVYILEKIVELRE
jgi:hypothetical protein